MFISLSNNHKEQLMVATAVGLVLASLLTAESALAGTGGQTEFGAVWTQLTQWMQGILGRIIAGTMILVGIIAGVVRQSLMAFAVGIGGGIGIYNAPGIIDGIVSATIEHMPATADAAIAVGNGLM
ncbi:MAG: conjugal transfer protein TraA [Cellvibrionaceae bacterium]|nr:conjugal transfer protein TraA [Cellvibrionaceae bacterium]